MSITYFHLMFYTHNWIISKEFFIELFSFYFLMILFMTCIETRFRDVSVHVLSSLPQKKNKKKNIATIVYNVNLKLFTDSIFWIFLSSIYSYLVISNIWKFGFLCHFPTKPNYPSHLLNLYSLIKIYLWQSILPTCW